MKNYYSMNNMQWYCDYCCRFFLYPPKKQKFTHLKNCTAEIYQFLILQPFLKALP